MTRSIAVPTLARRRAGEAHGHRPLVEGVEMGIGGRRHALPGLEHRSEGGRGHRPAARGDLVEDRLGRLVGESRQPVALLVPGHVADDPTDRVHRLEAAEPRTPTEGPRDQAREGPNGPAAR